MDSYQYDSLLRLSDGAAAYTASGIGQVAAANAILDLGGAPSRTDIGVTGGFAKNFLSIVLDVSAIDVSSLDESYRVWILGSNNSDGSKPVVLGGLHLGYGVNTVIPNGTAGSEATGAGSTTVIGRRMIHVQTEQNEVKFRYIYLYNTIAGTTPSITYTAFASLWPEQ